MLDEEVGMSFLKLNGLLNGTEVLTDKYEIEQVLIAMQQMERKVEFLKELKRRRVALIDEQISAEQSNIGKLEESVKSCMALNKSKSLDFPGVGKAALRNTKGTWTINDEEGLKAHLESLGKFDEVAEESWRFKKKDLNKLLDELQANNNASSFVTKEPDRVSLSVSYPKEEVAPVSNPVTAAPSAPSPASADYDKLEI